MCLKLSIEDPALFETVWSISSLRVHSETIDILVVYAIKSNKLNQRSTNLPERTKERDS